ncbi:hypothetical protein UA70_25175 [Raoultella planticola]|nr:hypothetical protein UA70_25175 [Raoultella planticola]
MFTPDDKKHIFAIKAALSVKIFSLILERGSLCTDAAKTASHSNNDKHGNRQDRYGLNAYFLPPRQGDMFTQSRQKSGLGQLCRRGG